MIRFVRKHVRSLAMGVIAFVVCLSMLGFGVDFFVGERSTHAIKVGEHKISYSDYYEQKRLVQESNRRMLGELYDQYEQTINARLDQELVENIISDTLLDQFAKSHELYAPKNAVRARLLQLFSGQFNPASYRAFLTQIKKTAPEFESDLERESLKEQLAGVLQNVSQASLSEARALYRLDQTTYDIAYLQFKPQDYLSKVSEPAEEVLQKSYEERAAELETPAQVSYQYVKLSPELFINAVEVLPEDIELYYTEHQDKFSNAAEGHFRYIRFLYPAKANPDEMLKVKQKAEEVLAKVKAGEPFDSLAKQHSDDFATSINGGDLGWLAKGRMGKEFDDAAFKLSPGQNSELISTDAGFQIVRMEEFHDKTLKPLDEVRSQIEADIRKEEAPGYMSVKAQELYDNWLKSAKELDAFAKENSLSVEQTTGLQQADKDPAPELAGLSSKIIEMSDQKQQLVELKDKYVLVSVSEFKAAETPPFPQLKAKLLEDYKKIEAAKLAQQAATEFAQNFQADSRNSLTDFAKSKNLSVQTTSDIKRGAKLSGFVASQEAQQVIFSSGTANQKNIQPIGYQGDYYLLQITALHEPSAEGFDAKRQEYVARASKGIEQALMASLVNGLKAKAEIDVAPDLLSN